MYDHTAILPVEYVEAFERFIEADVPGGKLKVRESLLQRLDEILIELDDVRHYSLEVHVLELLEFNQQLATILLQKPNHILPLFAEAIQHVAQRPTPGKLPSCHSRRWRVKFASSSTSR